MALPDFDATKHHIGLGLTGDQKGFFVDGNYQRIAQREGSPSEFGGERDQLAPSVLIRWTQDDFQGGGDKELWGDDAAMFGRSKNLLPSLIERSARTVPPLLYFAGPGGVDASASLGVFATGGKQIAVVDSDKVKFYNAETGALIEGFDPAATIEAACHDPGDNKVYAIFRRTSDGRKTLRTVTAAAGHTSIGEFTAAFDNNIARGIEATSGRDILVAFSVDDGTGQTLHLVDVNDARSSFEQTRVGRLPGRWRDSVTYNGLTYILLTDGEWATQVVAWDGSQILPIVTFPFNFLGRAITVYGGRIYVCGSGRDITDVDRYGELYEITGSSLRLVRSFADDARAGLDAPAILYEMVVHEGLLFVGTDLGWLLAYDLVRDGLWREIEIRSETGARTLQARHLLSTREKLVAWCYDPNRTAPEDGFYRMATDDADLGAVTYDCELETSDFAPEPAREKRLSEVVILTRAAAGTPTLPVLEYSFDGGETWTVVSSTSVVNGRFRETTFDLTALATTKVVRFRFTLTKSSVAYEEFVAFTMSFLMLETGKYSWRFVINGADRIEELDGETLVQDTASIGSQLASWFEDKDLLDFTDLRGDTRKVQITDIGDSTPVIMDRLVDGSREGFYSLILTEV